MLNTLYSICLLCIWALVLYFHEDFNIDGTTTAIAMTFIVVTSFSYKLFYPKCLKCSRRFSVIQYIIAKQSPPNVCEKCERRKHDRI